MERKIKLVDQLSEDGFTFSAIPPKFKGVGTFPVRAMARVWAKADTY